MADRRWDRAKAARALALLTRRALPPAIIALARPASRRPGVLVPLAVLSAWTVAEIAAEDDAANAAAAHGSDDRGTRRGIVGTHLLAWWMPLLLRSRNERKVPVVAGAALVAAGGLLRIAAIRALGARFTGHVRVLPGQRVCAHGPYALIRHPSYLGLFGINAGPALSAGSPATAVAMTAATALTNVRRVRVEEQLLHERLGAPYARYAATTPRFVPTLGAARRLRLAGRGAA